MLDRFSEKIKCSLSLFPCLTQGASVKSQVPCTMNCMYPDITGSPAVYHPCCLQCQEGTQPETIVGSHQSLSLFNASGRVTTAAFNERESGPQKPSQVCLGSVPFASCASRLFEISTLP